MPVRWEYVILGIRNPLEVLVRSRIALVLGELVPIPTLSWAEDVTARIKIDIKRMKFFMSSEVFNGMLQ